MKNKMTKVRPIIEEFLLKFPELRDNNSRLVVNVWNKQLEQLGIDVNDDIKDFLLIICTSLTASDTITRTSRSMQNSNKSLRGSEWEKRQAHSNVVKKELREFSAELTGE